MNWQPMAGGFYCDMWGVRYCLTRDQHGWILTRSVRLVRTNAETPGTTALADAERMIRDVEKQMNSDD